MTLFLFRFWPALIPLLAYWLWMMNTRRKARKAGEPEPRFADGPWYWAVLASLVTGAFCLLYLGATTEGETGDYIPPHVEDGVLVPGRVAP